MVFEKAWRVVNKGYRPKHDWATPPKQFIRSPVGRGGTGVRGDDRCVAKMPLDSPQHFTGADMSPLVAHYIRCKNPRDGDSEYCWLHKARDVPTDGLGNEMRI